MATKVKALAKQPQFEVEHVGVVPVESGMVVVGDPCYIQRLKYDNMQPGGFTMEEVGEAYVASIKASGKAVTEETFKAGWMDFVQDFGRSNRKFTGQVTGKDLKRPVPTKWAKEHNLKHHVPGDDYKIGVVSSTDSGDGVYNVFIKTFRDADGDKHIASLTVEFMDAEEVAETAAFSETAFRAAYAKAAKTETASV